VVLRARAVEQNVQKILRVGIVGDPAAREQLVALSVQITQKVGPLDLFDAQGKQYSYAVTEFYRLKDTGVSQAQRLANGQYMLPTGDERVTIVTCWPPTNNTHRLVVVAEPTD